MDSGSRDYVSRVSHRYRPSKMIISSESAKFLSSQPFCGGSNHSLFINISQKKAREQHSSSDKTKSFDNHVAIKIFFVFCERGVDDMAEVWLQTDVKESQDSQDLINEGVTDGRVKIGGNEKVLDALKELHTEEEEHSRGKSIVRRS